MKMQPFKKVKTTLTVWVINLHRLGYTDNFRLLNDHEVQCIQNGQSFLLNYLYVGLIDRSWDLQTRSYQYIHTIDTQMGCQGLLVSDMILGEIKR